METAITLYKELCYIETKEGDIIPLAEDFEEISKQYNNQAYGMNLGNEILSKSMIKRIFKKKCDEIDNAVVLINDKNLRSRVHKEVEQRRREGKRINKEILDNIIKRLGQ